MADQNQDDLNVVAVDIAKTETEVVDTDEQENKLDAENVNNDTARKAVADIMGEVRDPGWEILEHDDDNDLQLVHYTLTSAGVPEYPHVRGTVVSLNYECVVAKSYGHTPVAISDKLEPVDGLIEMEDEDGVVHLFNANTTSFHMGFEGTLMRMFKWNGKVYKSTHRRLSVEKSRWGNETKTFLEMYKDLNGPDTLFGDEEFSPYCHFFMLTHPEVVVGTKHQLTKGLLVYLGYEQMWDPEDENLKIPKEKIDRVLKTPELATDLNSKQEQPITFQPKLLNLDEVNRHLKFGFWSHDGSINKYDERLGTGEFIIAYTFDELTQTKKLLRIHSTAYDWRLTMRGNHPNLYCQFVRLANGSYYDFRKQNLKDMYNKSYPLLTRYDKSVINEYIRSGKTYTIWPQTTGDERTLYSRDGRYYNIWLCFLMSVPLHRQVEVLDFLDRFYKDRNDVIDWLQELDDRGSLEDISQIISARTIQIINETRRFANTKNVSGYNKTKDGTTLSIKQLTRNNIGNLIRKEDGRSLYKLIKIRQRYYKELENRAAAEAAEKANEMAAMIAKDIDTK